MAFALLRKTLVLGGVWGIGFTVGRYTEWDPMEPFSASTATRADELVRQSIDAAENVTGKVKTGAEKAQGTLQDVRKKVVEHQQHATTPSKA